MNQTADRFTPPIYSVHQSEGLRDGHNQKNHVGRECEQGDPGSRKDGSARLKAPLLDPGDVDSGKKHDAARDIGQGASGRSKLTEAKGDGMTSRSLNRAAGLEHTAVCLARRAVGPGVERTDVNGGREDNPYPRVWCWGERDGPVGITGRGGKRRPNQQRSQQPACLGQWTVTLRPICVKPVPWPSKSTPMALANGVTLTVLAIHKS